MEYIEDQIINKKRSPGAALAQIKIDGKKFDTEICETTLYNWIYRGNIFLNVTKEDLLYKGDHRKPEDRDRQKRARPAKGDTIEQRPEEINSRDTFGNWEMDSVMGCKGSKAALVVLTERLTRYPVIVRVPDHTMESVVRALDRMERRMGAKFREIFRSITVDIILQNDVWIGHGATVMAGVTLHNGCVVAANTVVTKDIPPYAIVGGNPARILRYRFDEDTIGGLQKIAWWDWPPALQQARKEDFTMPAPKFLEKYLPEAEEKLKTLLVVLPPPHEHPRARDSSVYSRPYSSASALSKSI